MGRLLAIIGTFIFATIFLGLFLKKDFFVESEVLLLAPRESAFKELKNLKNYVSWMPWQAEYEEASPKGEVLHFKSTTLLGKVTQQLVQMIPGERVDFILKTEGTIKLFGSTYFVLDEAPEEKVKLRWGVVGKVQFPWNLWVHLAGLDKKLELELQSGLSKLKSKLEE